MAASFVTESCLIPAEAMMKYLGQKDSSSLTGARAPYFTGGLVKYEVYIPDPAAIATAGLTGCRIPALVQMHAQGTGEWTGTLAAPTGNSGAQTQLTGQPGDKMGRNTTPVTNLPFYGIFPQFTDDWEGVGENAGVAGVGTVSCTAGTATFSNSQAGVIQNSSQVIIGGVYYFVTGFDGTTGCTLSGTPTFGASAFFAVTISGGVRKHRASFAIMEYVVRDAMAKYPIDRNRLYLTGVSSGGSTGFGYLDARARYPNIFTLDFACFIGVATWIGITARADRPEAVATEDYTLATVHRVARNIVRLNVPCYIVCSLGAAGTGDGTIAAGDLTSSLGFLSTQAALMRYWPTKPVQALSTPSRDYYDGGKKLQIINYTGGAAPTHNNVWPMAYSENIAGAAMSMNDLMMVWMMSQRRVVRRKQRRAA